MSRFHVFLNAPSLKELRSENSAQDYKWSTIVCDGLTQAEPISRNTSHSHLSLSAATIEAASRRISMLYENIIFKDTHSDCEEEYDDDDDSEVRRVDAGNPHKNVINAT
jgi:hypothetical protein